jgi:hypothetical protein
MENTRRAWRPAAATGMDASGARGVAPREWRFSAIRAIETLVPGERLRRSCVAYEAGIRRTSGSVHCRLASSLPIRSRDQ